MSRPRLRRISLGLLLAVAAGLTIGIAPSPAAAADRPPIIISTSPYTGMVSGWGGETISITFEPAELAGREDPLSADRSQLFINGVPAQGVRLAVSEAPYGATVQFSGFPAIPAGITQFRVLLVTESEQQSETSWEFAVTGGKAPGLVNLRLMRKWGPFIAKGAGVTLYVTILSAVLGCFFGLIGALGRLAKTMTFKRAWDKHHSWLFMGEHVLRMIPYWLATFYTSVFRGTPLLLQVFVVYYAVPVFINFMRLRSGAWSHIGYPSAIVSGVAALSLNYGAYITEVFRGGIQAVPKGQTEAAQTLSMGRWLTLRLIVLPQAVRVVTPTLGNYFISLIKDTSLLSVIAVAEVLKRSQLVGGMFYDFLSPLLVAAAIYWSLASFFTFWQVRLERRLQHDRAQA